MARAARPVVVRPGGGGVRSRRPVGVLAGAVAVAAGPGVAPGAWLAGAWSAGGLVGRCPGPAALGRLHPLPPLAIAVSTVRSRSVTRGPHRDAMSSLSPMMWPSLTAASPDQPGRLATVAAS